jgi:mobilization protein NikA
VARYEKTYAGERRTVHVGFYVTPTEAAELDAAAEQHGATRSDYARELLFRRTAESIARARRNPEAAGVVRALDTAAFQNNGVGNLLNQIARHLHSTGEVRDVPELRDALLTYQRTGELYEQALARAIAL